MSNSLLTLENVARVMALVLEKMGTTFIDKHMVDRTVYPFWGTQSSETVFIDSNPMSK